MFTAPLPGGSARRMASEQPGRARGRREVFIDRRDEVAGRGGGGMFASPGPSMAADKTLMEKSIV